MVSGLILNVRPQFGTWHCHGNVGDRRLDVLSVKLQERVLPGGKPPTVITLGPVFNRCSRSVLDKSKTISISK